MTPVEARLPCGVAGISGATFRASCDGSLFAIVEEFQCFDCKTIRHFQGIGLNQRRSIIARVHHVEHLRIVFLVLPAAERIPAKVGYFLPVTGRHYGYGDVFYPGVVERLIIGFRDYLVFIIRIVRSSRGLPNICLQLTGGS